MNMTFPAKRLCEAVHESHFTIVADVVLLVLGVPGGIAHTGVQI